MCAQPFAVQRGDRRAMRRARVGIRWLVRECSLSGDELRVCARIWRPPGGDDDSLLRPVVVPREARDLDDESRSAADSILGLNAAPMRDDQVANQGETNSTARDGGVGVAIQAMKRFPNLLAFRHWDARSLIFDPNACRALVITEIEPDRNRLSGRAIFHGVVE